MANEKKYVNKEQLKKIAEGIHDEFVHKDSSEVYHDNVSSEDTASPTAPIFEGVTNFEGISLNNDDLKITTEQYNNGDDLVVINNRMNNKNMLIGYWDGEQDCEGILIDGAGGVYKYKDGEKTPLGGGSQFYIHTLTWSTAVYTHYKVGGTVIEINDTQYCLSIITTSSESMNRNALVTWLKAHPGYHKANGYCKGEYTSGIYRTVWGISLGTYDRIYYWIGLTTSADGYYYLTTTATANFTDSVSPL